MNKRMKAAAREARTLAHVHSELGFTRALCINSALKNLLAQAYTFSKAFVSTPRKKSTVCACAYCMFCASTQWWRLLQTKTKAPAVTITQAGLHFSKVPGQSRPSPQFGRGIYSFFALLVLLLARPAANLPTCPFEYDTDREVFVAISSANRHFTLSEEYFSDCLGSAV